MRVAQKKNMVLAAAMTKQKGWRSAARTEKSRDVVDLFNKN
jgi:hypothetical protein